MLIDARPLPVTLEADHRKIVSALYGLFRETLPRDLAQQVSRQVARAAARRNEAPAALVDEIMRGLDYSAWQPLAGTVGSALTSTARDSGLRSLLQFGVTEIEPPAVQATRFSETWAKSRAAEMIGMRRTPDGSLVPNPNARYAITASTRDMVRDLVVDAVRQDWDAETLADELKRTYAFSPGRAEVIAKTELSGATNRGQLIAYQQSGNVSGVRWVTMRDNRVEPHCRDNERAGTKALGERFPSGAKHPPAHPNCRCHLAAVTT